MIDRPALRWFGGKWRIADWIISHLPTHEAYIEPFGGGASVLLRKAPAPVEVYNDLDGEAVNFFRVLRDQGDELIRRISLTPFSRAEHQAARQYADDPIERARRFYVMAWQSYASGRRPEQYVIGWRFTRIRGMTGIHNWRKVEHLYSVADRLLRVQFENSDALKVLELYDHTGALFYIDPPYLSTLRAFHQPDYLHEMGDEDSHVALASAVHKLRGMAVVSGYEHRLYDELYPGWLKVSRATIDLSANSRREVLYISPNAAGLQRRLL